MKAKLPVLLPSVFVCLFLRLFVCFFSVTLLAFTCWWLTFSIYLKSKLPIEFVRKTVMRFKTPVVLRNCILPLPFNRARTYGGSKWELLNTQINFEKKLYQCIQGQACQKCLKWISLCSRNLSSRLGDAPKNIYMFRYLWGTLVVSKVLGSLFVWLIRKI